MYLMHASLVTCDRFFAIFTTFHNFSTISGITLLGTPTEIYVHGTQYCFFIVSLMLMGVAMTYFYLPVFHDLQLTSTYQVRMMHF